MTAVTSSSPRARIDGWTGAAAAVGVAGALALFAIAMGWRGSDLPAQLFRVELFRRDGFVLWNSQWFSGHPTLDYSVLSPVLGAVTGPIALGALSGVVSAFLFDRLVRYEFGVSARFGSVWFATSTVTNLVVGRVTFALGVMFALGALLALQRRKFPIAAVCALLCPLASPVAGLFLAIAGGAWGFAVRRCASAAGPSPRWGSGPYWYSQSCSRAREPSRTSCGPSGATSPCARSAGASFPPGCRRCGGRRACTPSC